MVSITKTMADIAKRAGVSVMTVHRAIYNHPAVSIETRKKILKLASELNYRPNAYARAIRNRRFYSIGLITEESSVEMATIVSMFRVLNTKGMNLAFAELPLDTDSNQPLPKLFQENMVDGVIIHSTVERNKQLLRWLRTSQIPYIKAMSPAKENAVLPDYETLIKSIFNALKEIDCKDVIYLGPTRAPVYNPTYFPHKFFSSTKAPGLAKKIIPTDIDIPVNEWKNTLINTLKNLKKSVALVSFPEEARATYSICKELGKMIPDDVIILYIGTRRWTTDDGISLSGFLYSNYALGEALAKMILERIERKGKDISSVKLNFRKLIGMTAPVAFFDKIKNIGERIT